MRDHALEVVTALLTLAKRSQNADAISALEQVHNEVTHPSAGSWSRVEAAMETLEAAGKIEGAASLMERLCQCVIELFRS
jgi:hypothetical protein